MYLVSNLVPLVWVWLLCFISADISTHVWTRNTIHGRISNMDRDKVVLVPQPHLEETSRPNFMRILLKGRLHFWRKMSLIPQVVTMILSHFYCFHFNYTFNSFFNVYYVCELVWRGSPNIYLEHLDKLLNKDLEFWIKYQPFFPAILNLDNY